MPRFWSVYTAAPHRVLFLPGFIQGVLVMTWWLLDLELRFSGDTGLVSTGLPAPLLHGWLMIYGFFPFFVFGFLFTAAPNWLSGAAVTRPSYVVTMLGLCIGSMLLYVGQSVPGLVFHLLGWSVALQALWKSLRSAKDPDPRHAWAAWTALALGATGEFLILSGLLFERWEWLQAGIDLGIWGCLAPLFLTVCHRMIPWFTSRVVKDYVLVRPYAALWAMWVGCLLHYVLSVTAQSALLWLADFPTAILIFWLSARWAFRRSFQARLLAMLHVAFLWAGAGFALFAMDSLARFLGLAWSAGLAPLHALSIGFFGAMLIGMASRVSLGHSGRALQADAATWFVFWLIQGVALLRVLPDILSEYFPSHMVSLAGLLWLLVMAWWAWKYAPMAWQPRIDGKPG